MSSSNSEKILDRIEEGFQTPGEVLTCGECGSAIFDLTVEEIEAQMDQLAAEGKVEKRKQGKSGDRPGNQISIYVPKGTGECR